MFEYYINTFTCYGIYFFMAAINLVLIKEASFTIIFLILLDSQSIANILKLFS